MRFVKFINLAILLYNCHKSGKIISYENNKNKKNIFNISD